MRLLFVFLLAIQSVLASPPAKRTWNTHDYYVLEHDPHAGASLAECAGALGVEVVEQAGELANHWLVRIPKGLEKRDADPVVRTLNNIRHLASSSRISSRSEHTLRNRRVDSSVRKVIPQTLRQRVKRAPPPIRPPPQGIESPSAAAVRLGIHDPEFTKQWHLVNNDFPEHMMNVTPVWDMGITGKDVITALVDDGLDYSSDDLAANFYAYGSYDYNDHTDLPTPVLFDDHHGTRCAGQIAALKNDVCGVGIAYESKVAGIRILSGPISDIDEAAALNYDYQNTSIYSCSWGPPDDGRSMEGPGYLIRKAMVNGIQNGRGKKGSIFVFASGNGGRTADQCNFDGYTNSIFSVTVAGIDYKGLHPEYSEACAANMVVAYSSGSGNYITTTDRGKNKCSHSHGGTSAAAPNVAGVFALALQARPDLSWRDFQHLCVRTALQVNPDDPDWEQTAAGRMYSYKYGYGSLSGIDFVTAAQKWESVKPQTWVDLPVVQINNGSMDAFEHASGGQSIPPEGAESTTTITQELLDAQNFGALEHITIKVWITHPRRGDVEVELVSPNGVKSILAARRYSDSAKTGFPGWTFMTVKHWDENPVGDWTIRVSDQRKEDQVGVFLGWTMTIWGSVADASKEVKLFDVYDVDDTPLPPVLVNTTTPDTPVGTIPLSSTSESTSTSTKTLAHPPSNAEGEKTKPAFTTTSSKDSTATATTSVKGAAESSTSSPTPDEGWFSDLSNLVTNQIWFFVAVGAVVLFGIGAGLFFWRRAVLRKRRANYTSLRGEDDVAMGSVGRSGGAMRGAPRTKELYDAFGEVSDDEDADEETALRPHVVSPGLDTGLHSGFLEDDDPPTSGSGPRGGRYRDEPESSVNEGKEQERSASPGSPSGSGSSWEHASETR